MEASTNNNNEFYGWIAALAAVMFGGSFGVPIKSKAARSVDIDPLVFQTYKTIVCFVTACLLVYSGIAPLNTQSIPAGLVSGLFWVPSGVGTIYAVKNVGLVLGIGLNATMIILVSFFWGVFVFGERVRSKWAASLAVSCMILGLIGTCYFFSGTSTSASSTANNDDDEEVQGRRRRKSDVVVSSSVVTIVAKRIESSSGDEDESSTRIKRLPHHSSSSTTVRKRYNNYNSGATGHQSNVENNNNKTSTNDFGCAAIQRDDDDVESSSPSRKYYATTLASIDSFDTSTTTDSSTTDGSTSSGGESDSEDDGGNDKKKRDFSSLSSPRAPFSKNAENVSGGRVVPQCPAASSVSGLSKRQTGILSALLAGISAGSMMAPMQWCDPDARGIGFLFSFATGAAVITVLFWLLRYAYYVAVRNLSPTEAWDELPSFHFRTMWLPGGLSGLLWSTGNLFGLLSIHYLGEGIGQPVTQTGLLVSGLWGIFYFKEVTGIKRIAGWFLCSFLTLLGILLLGYEHHMAAAAAAMLQHANTHHSRTHT